MFNYKKKEKELLILPTRQVQGLIDSSKITKFNMQIFFDCPNGTVML